MPHLKMVGGEEGRLSAFIDSDYLKKGEGVSSDNAGIYLFIYLLFPQ